MRIITLFYHTYLLIVYKPPLYDMLHIYSVQNEVLQDSMTHRLTIPINGDIIYKSCTYQQSYMKPRKFIVHHPDFHHSNSKRQVLSSQEPPFHSNTNINRVGSISNLEIATFSNGIWASVLKWQLLNLLVSESVEILLYFTLPLILLLLSLHYHG